MKTLNKIVSKCSGRIERGARKRFVSAVAWKYVIQHVRECYKALDVPNAIGKFYLNIDESTPVTTLPNHIQVHCGVRILGLEVNEQLHGQHAIYERNAALVFTQHVGGSVLILLYPFTSAAYSFDEDYLIFKKYSCATAISRDEVEKAFSAYVRYAQATSALSPTPFRDWLFRTRFRLNDLRYRLAQLGKLKELISLVKP